jgi:hypothetical protein
LGDDLGDHAAQGEAEQVGLGEAQGLDEGDGVAGHGFDGVGGLAF